ncbi:MAG: 4-hydroxy-tetrahydrodipicolinate synthase [Actinobacteria bacterium]|nr:MAG: 4-hydroxy-tetrahydrodipicolinate synthase [Actinomycetota bacterium]
MPNLSTPSLGAVHTAMITPMTADHEVDLDGAARLAQHLIDLGNDGLVLNGTTGEAPTTTDEEKAELLRAVRSTVGPDVPLIAGVGTNDTRHSIELARQAEAAGADGLLVVTPYYSKPSQEGILAHFTAIADATELPVMLYDIPGRSAVPIGVDTLLRAAEHPRIVAVKDAKADLAAATAVLRASDLLWYSGDDALNLPFLSIGAVGFVSVAGHLIADRLRSMLSAFGAGDTRTATTIFYDSEPVAVGLFRAPAVTLTKAALELRGLPAGPPRLPLLPADEGQKERLLADLAAAGMSMVA